MQTTRTRNSFYYWQFYQKLKKSTNNPKTLFLTDKNNFKDDGLYILAPTQNIIEQANRTGNYNELSYVILWITNGFKIMKYWIKIGSI